jgi:hypothetical protein
MTDARDFLRAGDIARLSGASVRTVRRWIADEILPSVKVAACGWCPARRLSACSRPHHGLGKKSTTKPKGNSRL